MKIKSDFWRGFFAGWCCGLLALSLLLAVAGCQVEQPSSRAELADILPAAGDSLEAMPDTVIAGKLWHRVRHGRYTTRYRYDPPNGLSASKYDTVLAGPSYAAAKVAAVMAAEGITLPQVAAYLNTYGYDVINRAEFREWTWTPAPAGTNPIAYYVVNFRVATGTNSLRVYLPQTAGPYWIRVKAYDGTGLSGPWSYSNQSAAGALLPGVAE